MKRIVSWLFGLPTLIILLLFALANRQMVTLSLDPITPDDPMVAIDLPLWAVLFVGILLGLLAGGVATWIRQSKWRREARACKRDLELERLTRKRLEEQQARAQQAAASTTTGGGATGVNVPAVGAGSNAPALPKS